MQSIQIFNNSTKRFSRFKTTGWNQGQFILSSFQGRPNKYQEFLRNFVGFWDIIQELILRTKLNANYFMAILKNRVVAKKLKRWLDDLKRWQIQLDNLISKICYKERASALFNNTVFVNFCRINYNYKLTAQKWSSMH